MTELPIPDRLIKVGDILIYKWSNPSSTNELKPGDRIRVIAITGQFRGCQLFYSERKTTKERLGNTYIWSEKYFELESDEPDYLSITRDICGS